MQTSFCSAELSDAGESEASGECLPNWLPPAPEACIESVNQQQHPIIADDRPEQDVASAIV